MAFLGEHAGPARSARETSLVVMRPVHWRTNIDTLLNGVCTAQ